MRVDVADPCHELNEPETTPGAFALDEEHDSIRVRWRGRRRGIRPVHLEAAFEHLDREICGPQRYQMIEVCVNPVVTAGSNVPKYLNCRVHE